MIQQVSVFLENTAGRLAELTRALGDAGIDMRALMVADTSDFGVARIITDTPGAAKRALETSGFSASLTDVAAVEVPDHPGGLADVLDALGDAGVNVEYAYCFVRPSSHSAVDVFKVDDAQAERILEQAGFKVLGPADLYRVDEL
jgi:hypothetical protein